MYNSRDIFVLSLYFLTTIIALFGNYLVCKVVFASKGMRTMANLLIVNMAISDIICAITIPAQILFCSQQLLDSSKYSEVNCALMKSIQVISFQVSSLTVTAIAIDRYIVVHYPFEPRKSPRFFIVIIWVASILFVSITAFSIKIFVYFGDSIIGCRVILRFNYPFSSYTLRSIRVAGVILTQYVIPMPITGLLYSKIIHTIWKRNVGDMVDSQRQTLHITKWRTIKMSIIVFAVFALCWLPIHIVNILDYFVMPIIHNTCNASTLYLLCYWLGVSNCCYNPFIYWWLNEEFRSSAKSFWYFISCKNTRSINRTFSQIKHINRAKVYYIN
jgi:hypothetical protein